MMVNTPKRGTILLLVLAGTVILFIIGMSFVYYASQVRHQTRITSGDILAFYLAEAGIEKAIWAFKNELAKPLVQDGETNTDKLELLDFDMASNYSRIIEEELIPGKGSFKVALEIINIRGTVFNCFIGQKEKVPSRLNIYRQTSWDMYENKPLGGWEANLRIRSTGVIGKVSKTIEIIQDVRLTDLTPPASEYTLFISGERHNVLKQGEFVLSNWDFDETVGKVLKPLVKEWAEWKTVRFDPDQMETKEMMEKIKDFVLTTDSFALQTEINKIIMTLNPWGKVRTNGRLDVQLPFFEVDDIIHYFVDASIGELPEIGYMFCNNRLHDRFMGKYTRYEGNIRKYYFELPPYAIESARKQQVSKTYTLFSTDPRYPKTHPYEYNPSGLERLVKNARSYAHFVYPKGPAKLLGKLSKPLRLEGVTFMPGNVTLGGPFSGRGVLYVANGNVRILESLKAMNKDTLLSLVVPNGRIMLPPSKAIKIDAACTSRDSVVGGKAVQINGNLLVRNLNRHTHDKQSGMPEIVHINYNCRIRNRAANKVYGSIGKPLMLWREL